MPGLHDAQHLRDGIFAAREVRSGVTAAVDGVNAPHHANSGGLPSTDGRAPKFRQPGGLPGSLFLFELQA